MGLLSRPRQVRSGTSQVSGKGRVRRPNQRKKRQRRSWRRHDGLRVEAASGELAGRSSRDRAELVLCGAIVLVLLLRIGLGSRVHLGVIGLVLLAVTFFVTLNQCGTTNPNWPFVAFDPRTGAGGEPPHSGSMSLFSGMLVFDDFTIWMKIFLTVAASGVLLLCLLTGIPDSDDSADFLTLPSARPSG